MARINLLPWRQQLRRERQRQFMMSVLMTTILSVILVYLIGVAFDRRISHQESRNAMLESEIRSLELRITQIQRLEQTRERLLSRKRIIEELQASRSLTVELLDKLAKSIPVGVTLNSVRQQGMKIDLSGWSQSNARVSAYLQSLEASDLFLEPELGVVRTAQKPASQVEPYEFSIGVRLRPAVQDDAGSQGDFGDMDAAGGSD
jgi:type IV pilus assembly protein PilN